MGASSETDTETTDTPDGGESRSGGFKSDESKARVLADLKREREQRQQLEARLQEIEDSQKSEGQKLADRLTEAEQRAEKAEQRAARVEVALAKGLTEAQAKRLVGGTREELEADADELLATFSSPSGGSDDGAGERPSPTHRPTPTLSGGGDPSAEQEPDIRQVIDSIPRSPI